LARILVLSAPKHAGKTTACNRLVARARQRDLDVAGILALSRGDRDDPRRHIVAVDIATREERLLGEAKPDEEPRTVGRYRFDPTTMQWALDCILRALQCRHDLVIIDEIGPLELLQNRGYAPALAQLGESLARTVILVVRHEMQEALGEQLRNLHPVVFALTLDNREEMPGHLLAAVQVQH